MKNIELKLVIKDFRSISKLLKKNGAKHIERLSQVDTYFNCPNGRLKIREMNGKRDELIFYNRPDRNGSKVSDYQRRELTQKQCKEINKVNKEKFGVMVVVKKKRNLWVYGHTRVHLDQVQKLGNFLELETVAKQISLHQAKKEHRNVIKLLNLAGYKCLSKSYSEMLLEKN